MTHRDFSRYISTDADWRTVRRWACGSAIVYGLLGLLAFGHVAFRNHPADTAHAATATDPIAMTASETALRVHQSANAMGRHARAGRQRND